mmetsp:Transcript_23770/g.73173  ORF Transcript_23770/g.73173 Transcript_23770/m.73173 type:complete len:216 (+) Transcript_23770:237-884(+)
MARAAAAKLVRRWVSEEAESSVSTTTKKKCSRRPWWRAMASSLPPGAKSSPIWSAYSTQASKASGYATTSAAKGLTSLSASASVSRARARVHAGMQRVPSASSSRPWRACAFKRPAQRASAASIERAVRHSAIAASCSSCSTRTRARSTKASRHSRASGTRSQSCAPCFDTKSSPTSCQFFVRAASTSSHGRAAPRSRFGSRRAHCSSAFRDAGT